MNFVHDSQSKQVLKAISDCYHREIEELKIEDIEKLEKMLLEIAPASK